MKVFITSSFGDSEEVVEGLCSAVKEAGCQDFCFVRDVENYKKIFNNPQELMERSKMEIAKCDALLIDMTDKPTGRAIEAGIAYALGKKIIVIMKKGTKVKDTTQGIADLVIEYNNVVDITSKLRAYLVAI